MARIARARLPNDEIIEIVSRGRFFDVVRDRARGIREDIVRGVSRDAAWNAYDAATLEFSANPEGFSMNTKNLAIIAGAGVALYLLAKVFAVGAKVTEAAGVAYDNSRAALAGGLYRLFGPAERFGDDLYYTVKFSDGNHAVPSSAVNADGYFSRDGKNYRLLIDTRITSGVNKVGVPV